VRRRCPCAGFEAEAALPEIDTEAATARGGVGLLLAIFAGIVMRYITAAVGRSSTNDADRTSR
jgi:hypothetical protein